MKDYVYVLPHSEVQQEQDKLIKQLQELLKEKDNTIEGLKKLCHLYNLEAKEKNEIISILKEHKDILQAQLDRVDDIVFKKKPLN